ncbi:glutamic acid-rich protein-like [Saccostrea cucullata]|uniref:glutamic acid-rich protein-like n=1 Tax=Saccostrea cuccullata TaxID=36930 RepID=UPI002ED1F866
MPKQGKRKSYRSRLQQMRLYATQRANEDTEMGYDTKLKVDTEEKYDPTMMQDGKKQTDQNEEKNSNDSFHDPANEKDFHLTSQQSETDQPSKDEWKAKRKKESTRNRMAKYRQGMLDEQKRERKDLDKKSKQDKREHLPEEIKENIKASDRKRKQDKREHLPEEIKENIKASDRKRKRDKREQLPEEIKENVKASDQKRKRDKREQLPTEIKENIKASDRKRKRDKREQLPEEIKENIKASDQKKKKDKREHLPKEIKENIKASDQKRKKDKREQLPTEIKENIKASDRKRKKNKREQLPIEIKENIKASDQKRKKDKREKLPIEIKENIKASDRKRKKDKREQLPEETIEIIQTSDRKRKQDKRRNLPDKEKNIIKAKERKRLSNYRQNMPSDLKDSVRISNRNKKKDIREQLPEGTKQTIKASERKRKQDKREQLPEEIKKTMKASERKRKQYKREHLPNEKKNEIRRRDQQRKSENKILNLQNPYQTFLHKIKSGPSFVCICCNRLLYEQTVNKITKNTFKTVDPDVLNEALPDWCFDQKEISYICKTCILSLHKKKIPAQATINELHLTELKEPLISLTDFEARLVSQRLIFMKILALPRGRQKAIHGTVVNVPVDSSQTCTLLPRLPTNSGLIPVKLKRKLEYRGHVEFQHISPDRVISSLLFLKENNEFYKDVPVLENWQDLAAGDNPSLWERLTEPHTKKNESVYDDNGNHDQRTEPHNEEDNTHGSDGAYEHNTLGNDSDEWSGEDDDLLNAEEISQTRGIAYDTCIQQEYKGNEIISIAPGEGKTPVSLLTDDNNEVLAFPKLFPDGKFGFDTKRKIKLSLSRYINARLLHRDGRFARNSDYIFYTQHIRDLQHINGSISVALRKASSSKLNAGLAKDPSHLSALILKDHGYKFLTQVRGSPAYFDKMLLELLACVKQLGSFTWFITLSAADLQWPEGIQIIGRQYGHNFTDQDVKDMTWDERCRWIRQNPVTIARHFDYRLKQFIKNVLLSPQQPVGKVTMYMYRIEFQQRGSPHAHMAFWVEGTPDFENSTDEEIRNFHDQYVSCDIPTDDEELCELVKKVQSHVHSPSCRKPGKNCRFSFPKPPTDRTIIIKTVKKTDENQQEPSSEPANMTDAQVKEILSRICQTG